MKTSYLITFLSIMTAGLTAYAGSNLQYMNFNKVLIGGEIQQVKTSPSTEALNIANQFCRSKGLLRAVAARPDETFFSINIKCVGDQNVVLNLLEEQAGINAPPDEAEDDEALATAPGNPTEPQIGSGENATR